MKTRIFSILFSLVLVLSLSLVAAVPAMADGEAQTLNVAKWTGPTTLENVSGRQATIKVGNTYHMWYAPSDTALYHTSSSDPDNFTAGTSGKFTGGTPLEGASGTNFYEKGTNYMIAYENGGGGKQKIAIHTSNEGKARNYRGNGFDGTTAVS